MPIVTNFDAERGEVHAVAVGTLTFDDLRSHICLSRNSHGAFRPELIDARRAEILFTPDDVQRIADLLRREAQETQLGRTAFVLTNDAAFQLIRTLEQMMEGVCEVRAFRKEDKARAWLAASSALATSEQRPAAARAQPSSGSQ
jgi:hypothetical protein